MKNVLKLGTRKAAGGNFELPLSFVTATLAILARKGRGKSYTAAVFAEELLSAAQVPIVIDPTGAHWGLKSSSDGGREGFPVVVFGGDHADLPLEVDAGETIAAAIVEQRFPAILDLSFFRKGESNRFLAAFLETLYRKNRAPVHLLCDEADYYAPQQPHGDQARVLGAMEDIVRRGRIRGIGCTLITQRPAVLNKNVLTQADCLVALGMNHPKDLDAIGDWVAVHGQEEQARKMIASLPGLPIGEAWFWAPAHGDLFEHVRIRKRNTFDSSATPAPGAAIAEPKKFAKVDVAKLGKEIAATAKRADENNPAALWREIARLNTELQARAQPEPVKVIVPNVEGLRAIERRLDDLKKEIADALSQTSNPAIAKPQPAPKLAPRDPAAASAILAAGNGEADLLGRGGKRRILVALAQNPAGVSPTRLSLLSGIARKGGTWRVYVNALRSGGLIEGVDHFRITPLGLSTLGKFEPLPTGPGLIEYWRQELGAGGKRRIFDALIAAYPEAMTKEQLSADSQISTEGGTWRVYVNELRGLELIQGRNELRASDIFFT